MITLCTIHILSNILRNEPNRNVISEYRSASIFLKSIKTSHFCVLRRAFMQERIIMQGRNGHHFGRSILFFGCRQRNQDYLYGAQLESWAAQGYLTLFTAFSREQACCCLFEVLEGDFILMYQFSPSRATKSMCKT